MIELKPCPFCGGLPYLFEKEVELPHYSGTVYAIICDHCIASITDIDRELVEAKWNRRGENEIRTFEHTAEMVRTYSKRQKDD